jgi:probable F420-dependent oxidoreductase
MTPAPLRPPRLGVGLPASSPGDPGGWLAVFDAARAAEAAGIDRVALGEHVVFGERLDNYARPELGGIAGGKQPTGPDGHVLDPLSVLAAVSGVTTRVRLTTTVLLAALRRPVTLAKTAATIDVLSNGRLDLGVGVGWQREEYTAAGLDFGNRGKLLDETLAVMLTLWRENPASFEGDTLSFAGIHLHPKPRQPGGVPIWVSGTPNRAVRSRIVRFGAGWITWGPFMTDPRQAAEGIGAVRRALAEADRDPGQLNVLSTVPRVLTPAGEVDLDRSFANVARLSDAGVTDFCIYLPLPPGFEEMTSYFVHVRDRFRAASGS